VAKKIEKILIFSSNKGESGLLTTKLGDLGYTSFSAQTPEAAFSFLDHELIRIVFIDIVDNPEEKIKVITDIKNRYANIGIVVISANIADKNILRSFVLGAANFIIKPSDWNRLSIVIAATLERLKMDSQAKEQLDGLERELDTANTALENSTDIVEQIFIDNVKSFVGLIETRDYQVGRHCKRVSTFSIAISERYDIKDRVKREIEIGALLHDIGKIGLPDNILSKTHNYFAYQNLTGTERGKYEQHPIIGQEAVDTVSMLSNVASYIRHHHERFDGGGYPDKLEGFLIPLGARIIGLVDAYDKIIFRASKTKQKEAEEVYLKYLGKQQGKIFDPEAADKLIEFINDFKKKEFSREISISVGDVEPGMILARDVHTKGGVLVISQYEKISDSDADRLKGFLDTNMITEKMFIYDSSRIFNKSSTLSTSKRKSASKPVAISGNIMQDINALKDFATLPEVHSYTMNYLADTKSTRFDLSDIIKKDPVMVLKILRIANSPFFGGNRDVTTVEKAISQIGFKEIKNIVSSLSVFEEKNYRKDRYNRKAFWEHMVGCGIICRYIAKQIDVKFVEEYYIAGMLHDIGKLVFDQLYPDKFLKVIDLVDEKSIFYRKAERQVFEFTHEEVGEYIVEKWNLPDIIKDAVRNHHSPVDSKVDPVLVSAVHLADIIAHILHVGESGDKLVAKYESFAEQNLGLTLTYIETLIPEIEDELEKYLEISPA
jgi:response regulator RpfG family c-di-GMP phosphodiesterase